MKIVRSIFTVYIPLLIFIIMAANVFLDNTERLDSYVYSIVAAAITDRITEFMKLITFFGSGTFLSVFTFIIILVFFRKGKYSFFVSTITINLVLIALLNSGIKYIFKKSRPDILRLVEVSGYSFPSGHSMVSMGFYGFLIYLCVSNMKTRWKYLDAAALAILILLIGLSRIYLGVHYFSDVIGGFSFGLFWVGICSILINKQYRKKHALAK